MLIRNLFQITWMAMKDHNQNAEKFPSKLFNRFMYLFTVKYFDYTNLTLTVKVMSRILS